MRKLIDYVDILENNLDCVVLKVLPETRNDLICLGYFTGNETMFRLTKGGTHTCTVFYEDKTTFSWHWGYNGSTCVDDATWKMGQLIQRCIMEDLDIAIEGPEKHLEEDLWIQSKNAVWHRRRQHVIKVMGTKEDCIHKDGVLYNYCQAGLQNAMEYFKELGWNIVGDVVSTTAKNGCPIKTFTIVKQEMEGKGTKFTNGEVFRAILDKLPEEPRSYDVNDDLGYWTNGSQILCPSETEAEILASFLMDVFYEWENTSVLTGYFDPFEDAKNGEQDGCTGFYYVDIE